MNANQLAKNSVELARGWKLVRLGDIAKTTSGGTPRRDKPQFYGGKIPWVKSGELGDSVVYETGETITDEAIKSSSAKVFPKGTLCIALYGATVGKLGILGIDAATNQAVCGIFPPDELDTRYLYRFFEGKRRELVEQSKGGAQPNISQGIIRDTQIPLAPLDEQRRIVAEIEKQFTRLEAGVAALRRVQANLKRYRATVLKAACEGQLVPTEAELQKSAGKRQKGFESGEQLLKRILGEHRQHWTGRSQYKEPAAPDTAKLPPLPAGWTWASVEQLAAPEPNSITDGPFGSNLKTEHYTDSGPRVIRLQNIGDGVYVDEEAHISQTHFERLQKHRIFANDVVIAGFGEAPPRSCIIPEALGPAIVKADCIRFKPHSRVMPKYMNAALNSEPVRRRTKGMVHGVGRPRLNLGEIKSILLPLPPLAEQTRIVAEVERRLSVVEELESVVSANLQHATRLRQSILQKAFAGELVAQESPVMPTNIIPFLKIDQRKSPNRHFARALLSAEIVHRLYREPTFGRIKHQKIFHLCEHIAGIKEIGGQYHREAAGPLDNKLIYANEAELKKQKWYHEVRRESFGHAYEPMPKAGDHRKYVEGYWPEQLPIIEKLIELMRKWDTERCEIFCTAYAAWNDLILWGKSVTEENILHEILERWHDSKKRIPEERWLKAIGWMKKEGFVPTGFGKPTKEAK